MRKTGKFIQSLGPVITFSLMMFNLFYSGFGIFCRRDYEKGEFLLEYKGNLLSTQYRVSQKKL